jgi:hypothetical protein
MPLPTNASAISCSSVRFSRSRSGVEGDGGVLVAGRTRWKCATVINHLAGCHAYRGSLACILEAISRNKGSELEKLIADRCSRGMKLQFVLHRGEMAQATSAMVSENEQRDDDPLAAKISRAQRLVGQGHSNEDLAVMFGVSAQTIGRWLARDLSKPREKKVRSKRARPSTSIVDHVEKLLFAIPGHIGTHAEATGACMALCWVLGTKSNAEMVAMFPWLADVLAAKKARAA